MSRQILRRLMQWSVLPAGVMILGLATMQPVSLAQEGAQGTQQGAQEGTPPGGQEGTQPGGDNGGGEAPGTTVLTRGPVHEAFGQPTVLNPKPGLSIAKKPPQPVEELPPEEKPEGDNVAWIGGYWSYDEEKTDFMWVSGFWRVLPPGRQWMPGYWNDNAGQFQWVSGYWANAEQPEQQVIEQAPPESLEQGAAPETAPSQEHIWAPGCWVYRDTRYLWRPGYWVVNQPGWCWVPDCYSYTPGGYVYVAGYWDWSIRRRGVLFAPCYFDPVVVYRPGFVYRPSICLDIDIITPHFFCRPTYGHYYFGDYYATSYLTVGITPWFTYSRGPRFYSCDFHYYECHYRRTNPGWSVGLRVGYERYRDNVNLRPARTFVNQQTVINNITINNNKTTIINNNANQLALAKPIKSYTANMAKNSDAPIKFEKINAAQAQTFKKTANETRNIAQERVKLEKNLGNAKTGSTAGGNTTVRNVTLPKSPILSKMSSNNTVDNGKTNVGGIGGSVTKTPPAIPGGSSAASRIGNTSAGKTMGGNTGGGAGSKTGGATAGGGTGAGSKTGGTTAGGGTGAGSKTGGSKTGGSTAGGSTSGGTTAGGSTGSGSKTGPMTGGTGSGAGSKVGGGSDSGSKTSGGTTGGAGSKVGSGSSSGSTGSGSKVGSGSSGSTGSSSKTGGGTSSGGSSGSGSKVGGGSSGSSSGSGRPPASGGGSSGGSSSKGSGGSSSSGSSGSGSKKDKPN